MPCNGLKNLANYVWFLGVCESEYCGEGLYDFMEFYNIKYKTVILTRRTVHKSFSMDNELYPGENQIKKSY